MYKHHEMSIENMKEYFRKHEAIALILVGSVAKGIERLDSDLDGVVIISEEEYLKDLAEKGSEPARNGFTKAKILFCNDMEIENILPQIPVFQIKEREEKLLSFYSDF